LLYAKRIETEAKKRKINSEKSDCFASFRKEAKQVFLCENEPNMKQKSNWKQKTSEKFKLKIKVSYFFSSLNTNRRFKRYFHGFFKGTAFEKKWTKVYIRMAAFPVLFCMTETVVNLKTVLPGPVKPSLPLQSKMTAIFAPFTATQAIL
jgi:hypothetical protein